MVRIRRSGAKKTKKRNQPEPTRPTYLLRPQRNQVIYADSSEGESDSNNDDSADSSLRPRKPTRTSDEMTSMQGMVEPEMVDIGLNSKAKRRRSYTSKKTREGGQDKETTRVGQSSSIERGQFIEEGPIPGSENGSAALIGQGSPTISKKTEEGQRVEHSSGVERVIILPSDPSPSTEIGSPSSVGLGSPSSYKTVEEQQNKETSGVRQSSNMERGSFPMQNPSPSMKNNLTSTEEHGSIKKIVPSLPEGTNSTKKTILSRLIDCKLIQEEEEVIYGVDTKDSKRGKITRGGILCSCCQKEMSVWTFEKHAGSDLRQPYENIYLVKDTCLQDYLIVAWFDTTERKRRKAVDFRPKETFTNQKDGVCSICGDDGDLLCCKNCHFPNHKDCMSMKKFPQGTWLCSYCLCKYCQCKTEFQPITCSQCSKMFHWECFNKFSDDPKDISPSRLYCSQTCKEIYEKLEGSLVARTNIFERYSWRVIHRLDMTSNLHLAKDLRLENNMKVAVAYSLMFESFKNVVNKYTGTDVVHSVLYSLQSEDLKRTNFSRFHTFILEQDDAIICAASIRIHGEKVAEMPFITTDEPYRGRGICRMLMTVIESFLSNLKVQNLIIPSILETEEMWKHKFGFKELPLELKEEVTKCNILRLPNAVRLYKELSTLVERSNNDKGNKDKQTEIQNVKEIQKDNRKNIDLNMDLFNEDQLVEEQG